MPDLSWAGPVRQHGFTLIELMITVIIIGILTAIALPSYQEYVKRGYRASAQSEMMDIASREQQFFLANRSYADTLTALSYTPPSDLSARYTAQPPAVDNAATPPSFSITFTAIGAQASDGDLGLDSTGTKTGKWQ
jgi:type IV pilus assembly protein PilE